MLKLFRTITGLVLQRGDTCHALDLHDWDAIINHDQPAAWLAGLAETAPQVSAEALAPGTLLPPIGSQEVWAAGVTYFRSRTARMEEARVGGGGDFYDRVYSAERPELFFKATAPRVVGPGAFVRVRADSRWSVPEPELALVVNGRGRIVGFTIGNDMSARDIEGENPLYLPQAKVYAESCALGPCVLVADEALPGDTPIELRITRGAGVAFEGATTLAAMKRSPAELVAFLFRDNVFPSGCVLLTGTGVVPPDAFTLQAGDRIAITIPPIGTLDNVVR
jgi:2-dehydro-3-deoxy-D-arabinonate dehydratase